VVNGGVDLAMLIAEQRAVYLAEQRLDRAESELFSCGKDRSRSAAARFRYQRALVDLELARIKLHKRKCELAGIRHLQLVVT
jgi:hypothetical protein